MTTRIDTINRALLAIGEPSLQSEQSPEAEIALTAYDDVVETLVGLFPWSFAKAFRQLSDVSVDKVPSRRKRAFAVPADRMGGVLALFEDADARCPVTDFEVIDGRIESDRETLFMRYVALPGELLWPPLFRQCVIKLCASELALRIQERPDKAQSFYYAAMGNPAEPGDTGLVGQASTIDAQGQSSENMMQQAGPLGVARFRTGARRW